MPISRTQIDRLGDRLKRGQHTESDLRLLDDYRRSFAEACETVVRALRELGESPTARLAKSTLSIVEKLRRESIRLSQMQDIAGCRVVVPNIVRQDALVASVVSAFRDAWVIDRRHNPSYGYRAVHIIVEVYGRPVEIQVRSALQHLWAELSEKSSDVLDPTIKYGGGPEKWRAFLITASEAVASCEEFEKSHAELVAAIEAARASHESLKETATSQLQQNLSDHEVQEIQGQLDNSTLEIEEFKKRGDESAAELACLRRGNTNLLCGAISELDELKRLKQ